MLRHMEPMKYNLPPKDNVEPGHNPLLALMVDIAKGHAEMTLAQIEASLPANVPVYATRTIVNRVDLKP